MSRIAPSLILMSVLAAVTQAEVPPLVVRISYDTPLGDLMALTTDINSGIGKIINDELALGDESQLRCHVILESANDDDDQSLDCGTIGRDYSPEAKKYEVIYIGYSERPTNELEQGIDQRVAALVGTGTVSTKIRTFERSDEIPVWVHLRVDTSIKAIMEKEQQLISLFSPVCQEESDFVYICDDATNVCTRKNDVPVDSEVVTTYRMSFIPWCPISSFDDDEKAVKEMVEQLQQPLEGLFGMGTVHPSWYTLGFGDVQTPPPVIIPTDEPSTNEPAISVTPAPDAPNLPLIRFGSDDALSGGAIAGIIVGSVALVVILVVVFYWLCSNNGTKGQQQDTELEGKAGKADPDTV